MGVLRLIFAKLSFLVYSTPFRIKEWWLIRAQKRHRRVIDVRGDLGELSVNSSFVILAVFPVKEKTESLKWLIREFIKLGYLPIVVINENGYSKQFQQEVAGSGVIAISRPNIGRDFGAYQAGITFLKTKREGKFNSIKSLILCNDSVHYFSNNNDWLYGFLKEFNGVEWSCLYLNKQFHLHAQSFFLKFEGDLIENKTFDKFWKNYFPTSVRHLVINKGEVELSKKLLGEGFYPEKFATLDRLQRANFESLSISELRAAFDNQLSLRELREMINPAVESICIEEIKRCLDLRNPSHNLGLIFSRTLGLPLKYDILRSGLCTEDDLKELLKRQVQDNYNSQLRLFVNKGSVASKRGIERIWSNYGLSRIKS